MSEDTRRYLIYRFVGCGRPMELIMPLVDPRLKGGGVRYFLSSGPLTGRVQSS